MDFSCYFQFVIFTCFSICMRTCFFFCILCKCELQFECMACKCKNFDFLTLILFRSKLSSGFRKIYSVTVHLSLNSFPSFSSVNSQNKSSIKCMHWTCSCVCARIRVCSCMWEWGYSIVFVSCCAGSEFAMQSTERTTLASHVPIMW